MEGGYKNRTLSQTYVWHKNKAFFVSTINRQSSASLAYGHVYAETLVWEWNQETRTRGRILGGDECTEGSIHAHQNMVQRIFNTGLCKMEEDD